MRDIPQIIYYRLKNKLKEIYYRYKGNTVGIPAG